MSETPTCPACLVALQPQGDRLVCAEGHIYTPVGLALVTNIAAVNALWFAIRALEDDAAGLTYLANRSDTTSTTVPHYRKQAEDARNAALELRVHAQAAQQRLDALPIAPSVVDARQPGPGQRLR